MYKKTYINIYIKVKKIVKNLTSINMNGRGKMGLAVRVCN